MTQKLQIQLVTYNSSDFIEGCLSKIDGGYRNAKNILIIDNASSDGTIGIVKKVLGEQQNVYSCHNNIGFASAHNLGIRIGKSEYLLVLNPDVYLTKHFITELVKVLEENPQVGSACGKLLRLGEDGQPTNVLDSTGLIIHKNRRVFDRGQGEVDNGQYEKQEYIFGASGAAVLYRRKMLEDIKTTVGITGPLSPGAFTNVSEEFFDESFFAYKEDVDLAWRAQIKGWKCMYIPTAIAYHARGWQPGKRAKIPRYVQIHSFKNRYLMMLKNEQWQNLIFHLPYILWFEIASIFYVLFRAPYLAKGWIDVGKLLGSTLQKRKQIMAGRRVNAREIRKLFC